MNLWVGGQALPSNMLSRVSAYVCLKPGFPLHLSASLVDTHFNFAYFLVLNQRAGPGVQHHSGAENESGEHGTPLSHSAAKLSF